MISVFLWIHPMFSPRWKKRHRKSCVVRSRSRPDKKWIVFPGAGKLFYWQIGIAHYLNTHTHYKNKDVLLMGESSGALTITLMACEIDPKYATEVALYHLGEAKSVIGIWGPMVRKWLEDILPEDAAARCTDRVHIAITTWNHGCFLPERIIVSKFHDKQDLIEACLASIHIPYIIDGRMFYRFRGMWSIDGVIWPTSYSLGYHPSSPCTIVFDYKDDPKLTSASFINFFTMCSPDYLYSLIEHGENYFNEQR